MKVIHKIKQQPLTEAVELQEADVNPLEVSVQDSSADEQYKQAILKAIASETSAEVEYEQILQLEDKVSKDLVNLFHDTLVDIKNEEIKHLAQLTSKSSERSDIEEYFKKGQKEAETGEDIKESVELKEVVQKERMYSGLDIAQVVASVLDLNTKEYTFGLLEFIDEDKEYTPEEVDTVLATVQDNYGFDSNVLDIIENKLLTTYDPKVLRQSDFENDVYLDKSALEELANKVNLPKVKEKLNEIINYLETLQFESSKI